MAIEQLAYQCWYVRHPGGEDHQNHIHYVDQEQAAKAAREIRAEHDPDTIVIEVGQFPAACWTATCDSPCGDSSYGLCGAELEDGEWEWTLHGETRAEIEDWCGAYGWIVTREGQVFCEDDAPDCDRADLAVTEQVPGQLTLSGVTPEEQA